jgi:tRNA pseudouridine55 synthase
VQFKRIKRPIDGVLLLDKPAGLSSNQALQQVKHLFQAAKAGHTGSLDPFATGLLPICLGEATKFSHFLLDADKAYRATLQLGATSTTGDTEGEIIPGGSINFTQAALLTVLGQFTGPISQVPPMHSALKHEGKALYEYARAGVEIERAARCVTIHSLAMLQQIDTQMEIEVSCSKGTYIRTLAEDIGRQLGCGAYLRQLRRIASGDFNLVQAVTLTQLEVMTMEQRDACLLPPDTLLQRLPSITLDADSAYYLCQGQPVWKAGVKHLGNVRLYAEPKRFLGLGEVLADGTVAPRRLLAA